MRIDLVFCAGPLMEALWQALPSERRGGYANSAAELETSVVAAVRAGDAVMVKGSAGSKMAPIVKRLAALYGLRRCGSRPARASDVARVGIVKFREGAPFDACIGWLSCPTRSRSSTSFATSPSAPAAR